MLSVLVLTACVILGPDDLNARLDADGDGVPYPEDCAPDDAESFPGALERCDGVDNDCDGDSDNFAVDAPTWYADTDGDGWGSEISQRQCEAPPGHVARTGDCDDASADVHPMATEADCGFDATDYNCDGSVGYADLDGDGIAACGGDCDDADARRSPALPERCDDADLDEDCDGAADDFDAGGALDTVPWATDADGDSFGGTTRIDACDRAVGRLPTDGAIDCNDSDPLVSPAATESCDPFRTDEDCDGYVDETDPEGAAGMGPRWTDSDGDAYGAPGRYTLTCASEPGTAGNDGDCDDSDPTAYNGAAEVPGDGTDQDCDGEEICFVDDDGDGWGDAAESTTNLACASPGLTARSGDCDDSLAYVSPSALERVADGVDNDCDGFEICYLDADLDGYGDASASLVSSADVRCTSPGLSVLTTDCDDANPSVHPGAAEIVADGIDADCDARELCWTDSDRDGYGSSRTTSTLSLTCTGSGVSARTGDCYDIGSGSTPPRVYPGAASLESATLCMEDKDGDGWGDNTPTASGITAGTDCHDANSMVNPAAAEVCDGVDNNCDGLTDPGTCAAP